MMYGLYGNGYGMGVLGWVWMVIGWIIAIAIIAAIIRWLVGGSRWHHMHGRNGCCGNRMSDNDDSAITILREKYAKGEVTRKEFLDRKKDLMMDQDEDEEESKDENAKK